MVHRTDAAADRVRDGLDFADGRQSTATITSDALITAEAATPFASLSSSTASLVIEAVTMAPPMSILTCAVVAPFVTSTTLPLRMLRALSFTTHRPFTGRLARR